MKRFSLFLMVIALGLSLGACGKKKKSGVVGVPNGYGSGQYCQVPGGRYDRTVRGNFGMGGAYIQLDIYSGEAGSVGAVGSINISNLSVFPYFYGGSVPFSTCVSSMGYTGFINRNTYSGDDISVVLRGDQGTIVSLGQQGYSSILAGNTLTGTVILQIDAFGIIPLPYTLDP